MTLILSVNFGNLFVIKTSDTRRVRAEHKYNDQGVLERVENGKVFVEEGKDIKAHKITNLVLAGGGGFADISVHILELLKTAVKPDDDLAACRVTLEEIIKHERQRTDGPPYLDFLNTKDGVTFHLNGFYKDGTTGMLEFVSGIESKVVEAKTGGYQFAAIAPFYEYIKRNKELFALPYINTENISDTEFGSTMYSHIAKHLANIHNAISFFHPEEVSADFETRILLKVNGEIVYKKLEEDFSKNHKLIKEKEAM